MKQEHTPKPWKVERMSKPQPMPFYVAREILVDASNTHYELLRDENGAIARFETADEASATIAEIEGEAK
jgi:hypothetical protein